MRLLEVFAKQAGHPYRTAKNGQEAVDVYKSAAGWSGESSSSPCAGSNTPPAVRPEVILMDINMPIMDGFGATRAIRSLERDKGCSPAIIVAITGLGDSASREQAFASGMDLFLTKPLKMKELTEVLKKTREITHR